MNVYKSKTNCIVIILLVALLVAILMPLTAIQSYAEPGPGETDEWLVPPDVDDPIKIRITFGDPFIIEILDYNPKYLDVKAFPEDHNTATVRELFFGDEEGGDSLLEFVENASELTISGELDATIFDYFDKALAANAAADEEGAQFLTKVTIISTIDIPQSEIDYWQSNSADPGALELLKNIDFKISLPNSLTNHTYVDLIKSLDPKTPDVTYVGEPEEEDPILEPEDPTPEPDDPESEPTTPATESKSKISVEYNFGTWTGSGPVVAKIDELLENFNELRLNGKVVDPSNYTLTPGSTIITLHEDYLKTLAEGEYTFEAVFVTGNVPITLTIPALAPTTPAVDQQTPVSQPEQPLSPKTGDVAPTVMLVILAIASLGALIVVQKKRKVAN
jgi:LPXTG-motif cell wall-anchored protein